ncbi:EAL domain-containing protein [Paucibacter sp. B2R-40]|uniref:EAL domain-containing protein n=1 Tax=Paucibacter sp. B2R-40 TaxID=2893554 RepID=UPI0021E382F6|nr:EAL domain-containing protein [Paucibacter sp. B2R-40]MCV2355704.1 EAL domain-containing protein [Paucibacter sp. B2R-40]
MSVVRRAWLLITGAYLATLLLCIGLALPQVASHVGPELSARSKAAAQEAAGLMAGVAAKEGAPLYAYTKMMRAGVSRHAWLRFEIRDLTGVVVVPAPSGVSNWVERIFGAWSDASASEAVLRQGQPFGRVQVWVSAETANRFVARFVLTMLAIFTLVGAVLMASLAWLVRWAKHPLGDFHEQILGLSERRFVELKEPRVSEWIDLSKSLNVMVARVRRMLDERDEAVDSLEGRLAKDELTQTASRPHFMQSLASQLKEGTTGGGVAIVRVHDLEGINRRAGRSRADEFLVAVATMLRSRFLLAGPDDSYVLARLNGADFGLLLPGGDLASWQTHLNESAEGLATLADDGLTDTQHVAWIGGTTFMPGETVSEVLLRVDTMVMASESQMLPVSVTGPTQRQHAIAVAQWRVIIENGLDTGRFTLGFLPMVDGHGQVLYREAMLRLTDSDGRLLEASDIKPPAIRNGRISNVDLRGVQLALSALGAAEGRLAVNITLQSMRRPIFLRSLMEMLTRHAEVASRLTFEVDEHGFDSSTQLAVQALVRTLAPFGCGLGIAQFGLSASLLPFLETHGVAYVKLAARLLPGIEGNPRLQAFVKQLVELGRSLGVPVYAGAAGSAEAQALLLRLGVQACSAQSIEEAPAESAPAVA